MSPAAESREELFELAAVDTWFFREPRPFHADESVAGGMATLFPPPCRTLVGALRAALARAAGWTGQGRWPAGLNEVLGDADDLGRLSFKGPVLTRGGTAFYPLPRQLIGRGTAAGWRSAAILAPGEPVDCDLGSACLPDAVRWRGGELVGSGPPEGFWGTAGAIAAVLSGQPPEPADVVPLEALVSIEERVGISRDRATRTAADNALYAARHVRPQEGVRIVAAVAGAPADWPRPEPGTVVPFGGESRAAVLRPAAPAAWPEPPAALAESSRRYSVTFLTPAFLPAEAWRPGARLPGLPGKVVAACCGEPLRLGGWAVRRPIAARSAVPAGSTWFLELDDGPEEGDPRDLHGRHFDPGGDGRWGHGRMAVGAWSAGGREGEPR